MANRVCVCCPKFLLISDVCTRCRSGGRRSEIHAFSVSNSCLRLFIGVLMSSWRYLCLFAYCGVQHILCCVVFCFSSSCLHYVVSFSDCFCFVFLRLVYTMLSVSLDCFCFVFLRLVYTMLLVSLDCFCFVFLRLLYTMLSVFIVTLIR